MYEDVKAGLIGMVVAGLTAGLTAGILIWAVSSTKDIKPKTTEVSHNIPASVLEKKEIQRVYTPPDINDSADAVVINKDTVSYWYVYYQVNSSYEGYKVIKLTTSYFVIESAIVRILPNYKKTDFVGIHFFKRVPYETYKSYMETDGK